MNNRQSFSNDEWIRQEPNIPHAQYSPNVASSYNMRPPFRTLGKFDDIPNAKKGRIETSRFNSQFNERTAKQNFRAAVNFPPYQNTSCSPRLTDQNSFPSQGIYLQNSQALEGIRHERANVPNFKLFPRIPHNLENRASSDRNMSSAQISNVRMHSANHDNSAQSLTYGLPPANQIEMSKTPNLNSYNFIRQPPPPVSNMPGFIRQSLHSSSNALIRPSQVSNVSGFPRPPLSQGFNSSDIRHANPESSNTLNLIRQSSIPSYNDPNFTRMPTLLESRDSELKKQSTRQDLGNFVSQPPPLGSILQPPPNLPPSSNFMPNGNFACQLQTPSAFPIGANPPFTTMKQDSNVNVCGPNLNMPPPPLSVNQDCEQRNKIDQFLQRFTQEERKAAKSNLTMPEFRNRIRDAFVTISELIELKESLSNLLDANEDEWNAKLKEASHYKDKLTKECNFLSEPKVLLCIQERLKKRKLKRELKKKIKGNKIKEKNKKLAAREELHQTIDKWLELIKEKNLKLKRETEMKKEADSILAEVRRKIHDAKRTIDKIKVFEKLRSVRHANAIKKGLHLPDHDQKFKIRISELKATLFKQLSDYESEEKALKVMLEAEQEGQLEEETLWRIKKLKTAQQRRQNNIMESLFGNEEEPTEEDPIYLFHQFQNSGNKSMENLVQIRHHWDLHLNKDGEAVPSQWVVPIPPSSAAWEVALKS